MPVTNELVSWLQLDVNRNRDTTQRIVQHAERHGHKTLFIAIDAPELGCREMDIRARFTDVDTDMQNRQGARVGRPRGAVCATLSFIDLILQWTDLPWSQSITLMSIMLKGVQGVVLSMHSEHDSSISRGRAPKCWPQ